MVLKLKILLISILFLIILSSYTSSQTSGCCVLPNRCEGGSTQVDCSDSGGTFYPGDSLCSTPTECQIGCCCYQFWDFPQDLIQYKTNCVTVTGSDANFKHVFGTDHYLPPYLTQENIIFCNDECEEWFGDEHLNCPYTNCEKWWGCSDWPGCEGWPWPCVCGSTVTGYNSYCCAEYSYVSDSQSDCNAVCESACSCTEWQNQGCGTGECPANMMQQNRGCAPSGCAAESQCVYHADCDMSIACYRGSDCGSNGWILNPECSGKDIYQSYRTWTCVNPGTADSRCEAADAWTLKEGCAYTCLDAQCIDSHCSDGIKNADETAIDCGGSCEPCGEGKGCLADSDCSSNYCSTNSICAIPTCSDGIKNGEELDVDCGGACQSCGSCKPVPGIEIGNPNQRINLVFIPDESYITLGVMDKFLTHVEDKIADLFSVEPINNNRDKFNFYYMEKIGSAKEGETLKPPKEFFNDCIFADVGAILHLDYQRDHTEMLTGISLYSAESLYSKSFMHESGHGIFGLADEYNGYTRYFEPNPYPNIWEAQNGCRSDATATGWNPDECRAFTGPLVSLIFGVWWKIDYDNDIMERGYVQDGFGIADKRRINWRFNQLTQSAAMATALSKSILVFLNINQNTIKELQTVIVYDNLQRRINEFSDFSARIYAKDGTLLYETGFWDPRILLAEDGTIFKDNVDFILALPFYRDAEVIKIYGKNNVLMEVVELSKHLKRFCTQVNEICDSDCPAGTDLDCKTFSDVPNSHWAYFFVEAIYRAGITTGCTADNPETAENEAMFCPDDIVNREQMAAFIIRAMQETPYNNPTPTFEDVPKTHWAYGYIERLVQLGITTGCKVKGEKKYYCPADPVKRDQMAVFLSRAAGIVPYNNPAPSFADVSSKQWAYSYIEAIYRAGITTGCKVKNGKVYYCPGDSVSRAQMAKFLYKAFLGGT